MSIAIDVDDFNRRYAEAQRMADVLVARGEAASEALKRARTPSEFAAAFTEGMRIVRELGALQRERAAIEAELASTKAAVNAASAQGRSRILE